MRPSLTAVVAGSLVAILSGPTCAEGLLTRLVAADETYAAANPEHGRELFTTCSACHGANAGGNRELDAPNLTGQNVEYLRRQLSHFRRGVRGTEDEVAARMQAAATVLPDEQAILDVAVYVARLPVVPAADRGAGDPAEGARLYPSCSLCHAPAGIGIPSIGFPALRHLDAWYLVRQIALFRSGVRGSHPDDAVGRLMRGSVSTLFTDADAAHVAAYLGEAP